MRIVPTTLLAGVAAVALAGTAFAHTMTVRLPGGATEYIQYSGDVPPQVSFGTTPIASNPDWDFGPSSPFALMQQISAQMDREAAAMMNEMDQLQSAAFGSLANPGETMQAAMTNLPPGAQSYSFVSTLSPSGVCSQSVQITSRGPGQKPQIVTHSSGNCGAMGVGGPTNAATPDEAPATAPAQPKVHSYQANATASPGYRGLLHPVSW
ncbi:MAG TPA: hypothetical protein VKV32_11200 [Stellaceae bacterium]|nr:hypothetical protein [Stellaceae bacterium]